MNVLVLHLNRREIDVHRLLACSVLPLVNDSKGPFYTRILSINIQEGGLSFSQLAFLSLGDLLIYLGEDC